MLIDNSLATQKFRLAYIITGLAAIGSFVYIYFDKYNFKTLFILGCVFAALHILLLVLMNPCYFSFCDEEDPIVVRRFWAYPLFRKHQQFGIKKKLINKYVITKRLLGLQKFITITVRGKNKNTGNIEEYTFPSFNISALPSTDLEQLEKLLNKYINANLERISQSK